MSDKTVDRSATTPLFSSGPSSNCMARGTLVRTADGRKPIELLQPGDEVVSVDPTSGESSLVSVVEVRTAHRECVRLKTSRGALVCTSDHSLWSQERGEFSDAGNWALGYLTRLSGWEDGELDLQDVSNTSIFAGVKEVFDLVLDREPHTFVANGFVVRSMTEVS